MAIASSDRFRAEGEMHQNRLDARRSMQNNQVQTGTDGTCSHIDTSPSRATLRSLLYLYLFLAC